MELIRNRHTIKFGNETIAFDVVLSGRKRITINVYPDMNIIVCAPADKTIDEIKKHVKKKALWIIKQKVYFEQYQPVQPAKNFISGETHLYLGRRYRLKILDAKCEEVKLVGKYIFVYAQNKDDNIKVKQLLEKWYLTHAQKIFQRYFIDCHKCTERFNFNLPSYRISKMAKRWGSYTEKGNIVLNLELVKVPLYCIEYVIMHELCHAKIRNHNMQFYRLLSNLMPDWKKRKEKLDSMIIQ
jgi:predicted metal-dependent hydrolase